MVTLRPKVTRMTSRLHAARSVTTRVNLKLVSGRTADTQEGPPEASRCWPTSSEGPRCLAAKSWPHPAAPNGPRRTRRLWVEAHARPVFAHRFC